jgi:integrase
MKDNDQHDESITGIFEDYADYQSDDYINFNKFLGHYRGDLSKNTLVTYGRALKFVDFDPLSENPQPNCLEEDEREKFDLPQFQSLWSKRRMKGVCGKGEKKRATRSRQAYFCWLALKKYFKAIGEAGKIDELPNSDDFENRNSDGEISDNSDYEKVKLEESQIEQMMDTADEKMKNALINLYHGGMRSYELLHATYKFYDFTLSGRIEVNVPARYSKKRRGNRSSEKLYIKEEFKESLQEYILSVHDFDGSYSEFLKQVEEGEEQYLFNFKQETSKSFKDLTVERWRLWESIRSVADDAGLSVDKVESLSSHDFRTNQIRKVYDSVNDLKKTALVARHSSSNTTEKFYLAGDEQEKLDTYKEAFED